MITIKADAPGLRDLRGRFATWDRELAKHRDEELKAFLPTILAKLASYSPEDTGVFKRSWRGIARTAFHESKVRIWNADPKAPFVIRPTKPHWIEARNVRFLKLPDGFRKRVPHPGTKGSDVIVRAYQEGGGEFVRAMNRAGVKSLMWLEIHR